MIELLDPPCAEIKQMSTVSSTGDEKVFVNISVNDRILSFQVDTGASCTLIGLAGYRELGEPMYQATNKELKAYGGVSIPVKGLVRVEVKWNENKITVPLVIVDNEKASNLLGMDWFRKLQFQIYIPSQNALINQVTQSSLTGQASQHDLISAVSNLNKQHKTVFAPSLGLCTTFKADIILKPDARPRYFKPYNLPFAQFSVVQAEIDRLVSLGILKPLKSSEWAAPIVVVRKPNGKIRLCADFKVSVNSQLEVDRYPIPRVEELFHKLQGGQYFTKLDLTDAYLQIELSDSSKKFMVINTPFGLFQYQRMPFGIASAPGIFQRFMEEVVTGIPCCAVYLDDVIITGRNNEDHMRNLQKVMERLALYGLRCKEDKCRFAEEQIEYVGHEINSSGILPSEKRLDAVKSMPRPQNVKQVEAFIGKLNYYNKFVPNFSSKAAPLNELRRSDVDFVWTERQEKAFQSLKDTMVNAVRLVHYQDDLPVILATDASKYGIGAVISHRYPDGSEKPISFASKTLNSSQVGYSQIEKEALSIVYGVTKFHTYLYGRPFELTTDHQALTTLFHPSKKLPVMTLHRLQRWAIVLQAYNYTIKYKHTSHHANADALSRLPVGADEEFDAREKKLLDAEEIYQVTINDFPINASIIAEYTKNDPLIQEVSRFIINGWPESLQKNQGNIKPYFDRKFSLSLQKGIVLLHTEYTRVVVPLKLREQVLQMLHEGHWGRSRMKQMARRYVWFPKIDEAIERASSSCAICQNSAVDPKREFSSWPDATRPWERIHIDFAGPFYSRMWLIVVDSYSKFPYTVELITATSTTTISSLQKIFSIEGLPNTIVSDNGTQFTSAEFKRFCSLNSIEHLTIAPFHPASNGLAERTVRTFKEAFSKIMCQENNRELAMYKYLSTYRTTPDPLSSQSPAELLHGRQPRNLLSVLVPSSHEVKQQHQTKYQVGQQVHARNYSNKKRWVDGIVEGVSGRLMYNVGTALGMIRRHQNQLRERKSMSATGTEKTSLPADDTSDFELQIPLAATSSQQNNEPPIQVDQSRVASLLNNQPQTIRSPVHSSPPPLPYETPKSSLRSMPTDTTQVRRTERIRRKVVRFSPA